MPKRQAQQTAASVSFAASATDPAPLVHPIEATAAMLTVSPGTVRNLIARGDLEAIKMMNATRVTDVSVKKLVATARRVNYAA